MMRKGPDPDLVTMTPASGAASGESGANSESPAAPVLNEVSSLVTKTTDFATGTKTILNDLGPTNNAAAPNPTSAAPASALTTTRGSPQLRPADMDLTWDPPIGAPVRSVNDEYLRIFRTALGINSYVHHASLHEQQQHPDQESTSSSSSSSAGSRTGTGKSKPNKISTAIPPGSLKSAQNCTADLEGGRRCAAGIYAEILRHAHTRSMQHRLLGSLLYMLYFMQILIGATLTALGPGAADRSVAITILGACNTVIAGLLALIKGQGLPERLRNDEVEFRRLRDWVEETEALLAAGVIGKDRKEVGALVETAFKKYNAAKQCEDDNKPETYIKSRIAGDQPRDGEKSNE